MKNRNVETSASAAGDFPAGRLAYLGASNRSSQGQHAGNRTIGSTYEGGSN